MAKLLLQIFGLTWLEYIYDHRFRQKLDSFDSLIALLLLGFCRVEVESRLLAKCIATDLSIFTVRSE